MPPAVVFDHVFKASDKDFIKAGVGLRRISHTALRPARRVKEQLTPQDYEAARAQAEGYLGRFPVEQHTALPQSAIVGAYLRDTPVDTALWLVGARTAGGRLPGIAHSTIQALREIGLLFELGETGDGMLAYPGAVVSKPTCPTPLV